MREKAKLRHGISGASLLREQANVIGDIRAAGNFWARIRLFDLRARPRFASFSRFARGGSCSTAKLRAN